MILFRPFFSVAFFPSAAPRSPLASNTGLSLIVIAIFQQILGGSGLINNFLRSHGMGTIDFLGNPDGFIHCAATFSHHGALREVKDISWRLEPRTATDVPPLVAGSPPIREREQSGNPSSVQPPRLSRWSVAFIRPSTFPKRYSKSL